jgi:hypothetical protein
VTDPRDPASYDLPDAGPEPIYDTGSDAWWRAQAKAQREAADLDPPPVTWSSEPLYEPAYESPPALVEPQVLLPEPAALPDLPTGPEIAPELEPLPPEEVFDLPAEPAQDLPLAIPRQALIPQPDSTWYDDEPGVRQPIEEPPGGRQRLLGALLALAGVVAVIVALLVLRDDPQGSPTVASPTPSATASPTPSAEPTAEPTVEPTATTAPSATASPTAAAVAPFVPLTVLNNSKITGLADRSAAKFRAAGWPIKETDNYRGGNLATSTVFYAPGQKASAERFARQFDVQVRPRFDGLPGSGLTVVLTRDYS